MTTYLKECVADRPYHERRSCMHAVGDHTIWSIALNVWIIRPGSYDLSVYWQTSLGFVVACSQLAIRSLVILDPDSSIPHALLVSWNDRFRLFSTTIAGKDNANADAPSRLPLPDTPADTFVPPETVFSLERLAELPIKGQAVDREGPSAIPN